MFTTCIIKTLGKKPCLKIFISSDFYDRTHKKKSKWGCSM